jgi:hypothetical protein
MEAWTDRQRGVPVSGSAIQSSHVRAHHDHASWMLTSLLLWLCSLPLIGLLVLPWLGSRVALAVAALLLVASVTACYGICTWQVAEPRRGVDDD